MKANQLRRLKELEKENERLRRVVSDLTLDKQILKETAHLQCLHRIVQRVVPGGITERLLVFETGGCTIQM